MEMCNLEHVVFVATRAHRGAVEIECVPALGIALAGFLADREEQVFDRCLNFCGSKSPLVMDLRNTAASLSCFEWPTKASSAPL